jgi:hypothetical protein
MYYAQHKYQYRSDDGASDQCDEFVDTLGRNKEELGHEEAYAPHVTCPREAECDRQGKESDGVRFSETEVAGLEKKLAQEQDRIGKTDEHRRQGLIPQVADV